jgi:predicted TIM-barrel fold metal-dependent hydrolase
MFALDRRGFVTFAFGSVAGSFLPTGAFAEDRTPFDLNRLKKGYLDRLFAIRKSGLVPVIDIESSYDPTKIDLPAFVKSMDRAGIAQMALSADQPGRLVNAGDAWSHHNFDLIRAYPGYFIPTGNGGNHPAWTRGADRFLDDNERFVVEHGYALMGEFEFRHYPSPRQIERNELFRDVDIAIDGPQGHRLFAFAEKTGIPFQIHYEIEDQLLAPLDAMLTQYPKAKVIWCHLAQIRFSARGRTYGAVYLRDLLAKHPNLYIDVAFGGPNSIYRPSNERHARVWDSSGDIRREWRDLIVEQPYRFLAALDIGGDRMERVEEWMKTLRRFLDGLPGPTRAIVAHGAAWKLLFGETIPA